MAAATDTAYRAPFDRALLLVVPAAAFMLLLFIYPFIYGLLLSFNPKEGGALANYARFSRRTTCGRRSGSR
jgi:ABC-type sugar transport system permease subunit